MYFDDFKVEQVKSPVVQSDDYYPFGLRYNSYNRENSVTNKIKLFQGQEHVDDLGLNWDSFKWRNHQPDIGRFFNVDPLATKYVYNSPYSFSENHVTSHIELEGLEMVDIKQDGTKRDPPPQGKGKPDEGKSWTGLDFLNFTQGMAKETPGSQSGTGALVHNEGGGPDAGYVRKADPKAALLDVNKDGLDAVMAVAKTMPRGGGFGESVKNVAEGAATLQAMDASGQKVSQKAAAAVRDAVKLQTPETAKAFVRYNGNGTRDVGTYKIQGKDTFAVYNTINVSKGDTSAQKISKVKNNVIQP